MSSDERPVAAEAEGHERMLIEDAVDGRVTLQHARAAVRSVGRALAEARREIDRLEDVGESNETGLREFRTALASVTAELYEARRIISPTAYDEARARVAELEGEVGRLRGAIDGLLSDMLDDTTCLGDGGQETRTNATHRVVDEWVKHARAALSAAPRAPLPHPDIHVAVSPEAVDAALDARVRRSTETARRNLVYISKETSCSIFLPCPSTTAVLIIHL
jgi:hypothetical protein